MRMVSKGGRVWRAVLGFAAVAVLVASCGRKSSDGSSREDPNEPEPPTPEPLYAACTVDEDCESGFCSRVNLPLAYYVCSRDCTSTSECEDGVCVQAPAGESICSPKCTTSTQRVYSCIEGVPIPCGEPGTRCPDCPCAEDEFCSRMQCTPKLGEGESCTSADDCAEGPCCVDLAGDGMKCSPPGPCPGAPTTPCLSDADCLPGRICNGTGRGWCVCEDLSESGCRVWPRCVDDAGCEPFGPGAVCDDEGFCSLGDLGSGVACEDSSWCVSGTCDAGRCTGAADIREGQPCEDRSWCEQDANENIYCCPASEEDEGLACTNISAVGCGGCQQRIGGPCQCGSQCFSGRCSGAGTNGVCLAP